VARDLVACGFAEDFFTERRPTNSPSLLLDSSDDELSDFLSLSSSLVLTFATRFRGSRFAGFFGFADSSD